jgi:hypothetical protein
MSESEKKPKLCMFCGLDESVGPMNMEHFVPKCLWAGPRPKGTVTVPAHTACNAAFADDNEYFRLVLVSDDDVRTHPQAKQLLEGPVERLIVKRTGQYLRHAKDLHMRRKFTRTGLYVGEYPCFTIDFRRISRVLENVVKGMFYSLTGAPLAANRKISVWNAEEPFDKNTCYFVDHMCGWQWFGDDVFSCRYGFKEGMDDIVALLCFYDRKHYVAATREQKAEEPPDGE